MILVTVKPLGQSKEFSYYFDEIIMKKSKIKGKTMNSYFDIAETFGHAEQNYRTHTTINDITLEEDARELFKIPEDLSNQCYYITMRYINNA
ncbi:MAG: hypothetical protein GXO49_05070 [Chlorobi bacterium]|nr:hypothetical protein [Chlorobiota bacterium]